MVHDNIALACLQQHMYTRHQFEENDRSILEGQTEGFVKIHVKRGTDNILGATIVGDGAGDMIRFVRP